MKAWMLPAGAVATMLSTGAFAVERDGIPLGSGVSVYPAVGLEVTDNDNVYLQPEETQTSSTITKVTPALGVEADMGQQSSVPLYSRRRALTLKMKMMIIPIQV